MINRDAVSSGAVTSKPQALQAGSDGGWVHSKAMQHRYVSPTKLTSFDGESAWRQYDPHILVPKEWGKQGENFENSLRDWPEPDWVHTSGGQPSWQHGNLKRWPLHRCPKFDRPGVEANL